MSLSWPLLSICSPHALTSCHRSKKEEKRIGMRCCCSFPANEKWNKSKRRHPANIQNEIIIMFTQKSISNEKVLGGAWQNCTTKYYSKRPIEEKRSSLYSIAILFHACPVLNFICKEDLNVQECLSASPGFFVLIWFQWIDSKFHIDTRITCLYYLSTPTTPPKNMSYWMFNPLLTV